MKNSEPSPLPLSCWPPPSRVLPAAPDVKIKMWKLPSDTHYPHDPLVSHDGYIWYTGNKSNNIGRFDPRTETFKEWSTDIPNSGPHGIVEDKDGNIWFTANMAKPTYIGKFDPRAEKFTVLSNQAGRAQR